MYDACFGTEQALFSKPLSDPKTNKTDKLKILADLGRVNLYSKHLFIDEHYEKRNKGKF